MTEAQSESTEGSPVQLRRIYRRPGDEGSAVRIQLVAGDHHADFRLDSALTPELVDFLVEHAAAIPLDTQPE